MQVGIRQRNRVILGDIMSMPGKTVVKKEILCVQQLLIERKIIILDGH